MPFPFWAMEKYWVNPHFPARGNAELPVQSTGKARARNTQAGRELRGRLYSKLLQQLNLNIKLISLRGLITALIAAQVITEWDITAVISIYYRIGIRYYCICQYLYQSVPVSGDEWDASDKKSWAGVTPTALRGNVCLCIWEALSEEFCSVLTTSCFVSARRAGWDVSPAGTGAPRGPSPPGGRVEQHQGFKS